MVLQAEGPDFLEVERPGDAIVEPCELQYCGIMHYGNRGFAECFLLCRVPNVGHSIKIDFVECRTRQIQTLGISFFAECQALGKG